MSKKRKLTKAAFGFPRRKLTATMCCRADGGDVFRELSRLVEGKKSRPLHVLEG